ncbi:hypothetical protein BRPE64_CCDS02320 [Caballeronia insecticola]|uniref:Uncharacterized protein n=1 Tax=Caballeronia insecticola TaxID=758793 RepID=R4WY70_9BURK|nr:hypothetical protein BRPE64_CCDS02320 [Caballeronia insecticola]
MRQDIAENMAECARLLNHGANDLFGSGVARAYQGERHQQACRSACARVAAFGARPHAAVSRK